MSMLTTLLRIRVRLARLFRFSENYNMLLWAAVSGLVGALATIVFREGIHGVQWVLTGRSGSLVEIAESLQWQWRIVLPVGGGVAAGFLLMWAKRFTTGTSDYMEAVAIGDGRIPVRESVLRSLSSLVTIATGGSIGREGSMVQLAAMTASLMGRITHFDPPRLRLLVACGAAAGLTSAYNAPIAGAFFVTEIVLGSIAMDSFGPIVVASVVANITMREFPGYQPTYAMPAFPAISGVEMLFFVGLGVLCGMAAPPFLRLLGFSKRAFERTGLPLPARLGLGGLLVGVLSVWVPQVWGNGYSVVNALLHSDWAWNAVLAVLVFKVVATAFTTGSGAVGGVFTPTLFVGAAFGHLAGGAVHTLFPAVTSAPFAYTIVGMGAFLAATTRAPLMAILMIFEMTLSYAVMLPLMLASVVAYVIARSIDQTSMYEITAKRHREATAQLRLRATQMRDLIKPADTVLPLTASFAEISKMFLEYPVKYLYVVDAHHRYQGVVSLQEITSALLENGGASDKTAADFVRRDSIGLITPDMSLGQALQHFLTHQGERLPAVDGNANPPMLLGVVYKSSLLEAYFKLNRLDNGMCARGADPVPFDG